MTVSLASSFDPKVPPLKLYIGNKNYSSWSLRPWLLMRESGIAFDEVKLGLDWNLDSPFKQTLLRIAPTGKVPLLVDDDGFAVWDTLAIAEYLADRHPTKHLWPPDMKDRARARSLCAEMHSGFGPLRQAFPMNSEAHLPEAGARILREQPAVVHDLDRIDAMWSQQLAASGGPFLFGAFGIADAFYAPVASRLHTYGLPVCEASAAYGARLRALPSMQAWAAEAVTERDFIEDDEPYRKKPVGSGA